MAGKMNPEVKSLLVNALRSGEYEQGSGYLNQRLVDEDNGAEVQAFCCLGVLCDVAIKNGVDLKIDNTTNMVDIVWYEAESAYLPVKVQEWSGLNDVGDFPGNTEWDTGSEVYTSLIEANDNGQSFAEIADFIEREF